MNIFKYSLNTGRSSSVVNYTRPDLTTKWLNRIQTKSGDSASQEAVSKLSSLVAYFSKPADKTTENIDWAFWKQNIRTEGIVDKLHEKVQAAETKTYNVEALAARSAATSDRYEKVGLFLKYNHDIWMLQYKENLEAYYNASVIGDFFKIQQSELMSYGPGISELMAGWRETGNITGYSVYHEDSWTMNVSSQFRYSNSSHQPYYHPVCAWERGLYAKHALMSL